jgi:hypothetical protein
MGAVEIELAADTDNPLVLSSSRSGSSREK